MSSFPLTCPVCGKTRTVASVQHHRKATGICRHCAKVEDHAKRGTTQHKFSALHSRTKQKCYNPNNSLYHTHGGKGITMCPEWLNNRGLFFKFLEDHGYDPSKNRLTRKDTSGPFSPENCTVTLKNPPILISVEISE